MSNSKPNLRQDLTLHELDCLNNLLVRKDHYLDISTSYAGYYLQMKLYGTLTFRILRSHGTWIKVKRELESVGLDIDALPDWTEHSEKVAGVRWYKKDLLKTKDVWSFLTGVNRRDKRRLDAVGERMPNEAT